MIHFLISHGISAAVGGVIVVATQRFWARLKTTRGYQSVVKAL